MKNLSKRIRQVRYGIAKNSKLAEYAWLEEGGTRLNNSLMDFRETLDLMLDTLYDVKKRHSREEADMIEIVSMINALQVASDNVRRASDWVQEFKRSLFRTEKG